MTFMDLYNDGENSKEVIIYFVQNGISSSKEMLQAFTVTQDAKFKPKIVSEDVIQDIELGKNTVFVLEKFSLEIFDYLSSKECLVVGPSCLHSCIIGAIPIPDNNSPIYNLALRGSVICTTTIDISLKDEIKKLVGYMGGIYTDQLTLAVTHLITDKIMSISSGKCQKAVNNNIPIVKPDWIFKCWELSQMDHKTPDAVGFRLPPFQGMYITCSNLTQVAKKNLHKMIEANGGIYLRTLELNKTAVLVIGDPEGKKWQHAQQWGIPCVSPSWVYESVERGITAPSKNHLVLGRPKCSTPTNSGEQNSFMSCSDISLVPMAAGDRSRIDETNISVASSDSLRLFRAEEKRTPQRPPPDGEYKKLLEEINMLDVKAAGLFLDGCKIYLSGFSPQECEKLKRLINSGGATLFTSLSDNLSHVVVGDFSATDAKELTNLVPRPHVVKLQWLIQCLKEHHLVGVENYLCLQSAPAPPASPLSHKGLKLLKSQSNTEVAAGPATPLNELKATVSRKLFVKAQKVVKTPEKMATEQSSVDYSALERRAQEELLREKENTLKIQPEVVNDGRMGECTRKSEELKVSKEDQSSFADQSTLEPFFQGLTFEILGYDEIEQIKESIEKVGGKLISRYSNEVPDYTIVPVEGANLKPSGKNVVSIIFVEDCYDHECLIQELEYYHRPIPGLLTAEKKLEGEVFALSGFGRAERRLLVYVANNLGAIVQDMFSRSDHPAKGVKKSTHLLCKEATGKKYEAALKWGIPVASPEWLIGHIESRNEFQLSTEGSVDNSVNEGVAATRSCNTGEDKDTSHSVVEVPEPMEVECSSDGPNDITPLNAALKRMSVPGSAGNSPFHVQTPDTPYGKVFSENTPSPSTRKRWKQWIDGIPDLYEGSPNQMTRSRRPSTPLEVVKKQLWVKYGGVKIDGIEQSSGKLLKNGPYSEWAKDSESESGSRNSSVSEKENLKNLNDPDSIFSALQAKISESQLASLNIIDELKKAESLDELSPHLKQRLSNRISQAHPRQCGSPNRDWGNNNQGGGHFNENNVVMWDFSNGKNPGQDGSTAIVNEESSNSSAPYGKDFSNLQPASKSKHSVPEISNRPDLAVCNVQSSIAPVKTQKLEENTNHAIINDFSKIFLLSGMSAEARQKYEGIIRHLGGAVTHSPTYDPSTTHIIIEKPIRSEKLLCCIASGKWVLHTSYLDSCYESRQFLQEEEYEWGNQRSVTRLPKMKEGSTEAGLAAAGYKWRQRKQDMGSTSPFRDMKVSLFTAENKKPQFTRLLEAGGATVFQQNEILKCNYLIWEEGKVEIPVPLKELAYRKVHVVAPVFLGEFLVKATPPSDHYPPSYIAVIKQMKQHKY